MPRDVGGTRPSRPRRAPVAGAPLVGARTAGLMLGGVMLGGALLARPAAAQEIEYHGAVQASSGDYLFTERTTTIALVNGLSLISGRLRLSAALPLYYQNSSAVTYVGGVPVPTGGPDAAAVRSREPGGKVPMGPGRRGSGGPSGAIALAAFGAHAATAAADTTALVVTEPGDYRMEVGDPLLQVGVDLLDGSGPLRSVAVSALAKAPVADVESGVGTGEWDYGAGLSASFGGGRTFVLADASYWVVGDLPDLPLRNTLSYSLSVGRLLGADSRWSALGSVLGATSMIEGADAPLSLGVSVGYAAGTSGGGSAGIGVGLTETSPDLSLYVGWSAALGGR